MADKDSSKKIDLSGFSDDQISSLYKSAQRGVRRQGYDGSNDVQVDYDPMPSDAIYANSPVMTDWTKGQWKDVKEEADKVGMWSDEDTIHKMRGAVAGEFLERQDARFEALENGAGSEAAEEVKEPFQEEGKSDEHLAAESQASGNGQGNAGDSYQSAFDRAVAAGRDISAGDYLRQRADDKKGGVNRFTAYLKDSNTLASHEGHHAAMNAIKKAEYEGLNPPELIDPGDLYDDYKKDIDKID